MEKRANNVAGTWQLVSAQADPDGENRPLYGSHPSGLLIFTQDLHFTVVLHDPAVPAFAAPDRSKGTAAENKAAVAGALALYGTYTVDENGNFAGEQVIGSTFPNWNGLKRDHSRLTETVQGNLMTEHLTDPAASPIVLTWQRVGQATPVPGVAKE